MSRTSDRPSLFRRALLALGLAVLLPWMMLAVAAAEEAGASAADLARWKDLAYLEKHLALACDAVEAECGAKFAERPKIRLTTAEEMRPILKGEVGDLFRRIGALDDAGVDLTIKMLCAGLAAKCEPERNLIHVLPENVADLARSRENPEMASEGLLRMLLVHETTHALDFERFPELDRQRRESPTLQASQVIGAVVEGHAQHVTGRVAAKWKTKQGFDALIDLTISRPPNQTAIERVTTDMLLAQQRFAYVQGQVFFDEVYRARGLEGVNAAMAKPPGKLKHISRPASYLDPTVVDAKVNVEQILAPAAALAKELGWSTREIQIHRLQYDGIFAMLPPEQTGPVGKAYRNGWASILGNPASGTFISAIVFQFATAEGVAGHMKMTLDLLKKKDALMKSGAVYIKSAAYEEGTGLEGALPGLVCTKVVASAAGEQTVVVHASFKGTLAIELTFVDTDVSRSKQNVAMHALVTTLRRSVAGVDSSTPTSGPAPAEAGGDVKSQAEALKALAQTFHKAQSLGDAGRLKTLARALCPTHAELESLCKPGAAQAFLDAYHGPKDLRLGKPEDARMLEAMGRALLAPGEATRTEVHVHAATTEELVAYEKGSPAHAEFPGGMQRFAERVAAPGRTWYVVEWTEPGSSSGMKYTCFTRIGERFVVVIKPWRSVPR